MPTKGRGHKQGGSPAARLTLGQQPLHALHAALGGHPVQRGVAHAGATAGQQAWLRSQQAGHGIYITAAGGQDPVLDQLRGEGLLLWRWPRLLLLLLLAWVRRPTAGRK